MSACHDPNLRRGVAPSADPQCESIGVEAGERGQRPVGEADGSLRGPPQVRLLSPPFNKSEFNTSAVMCLLTLYSAVSVGLKQPAVRLRGSRISEIQLENSKGNTNAQKINEHYFIFN